MKVFLVIVLAVSILNANNNITKELTLSTLNSTSYEIVNDPNTGKQISELIWEAKGVNMIGLKLNYQIQDSHIISLSYKTNITDGDSVMDDYDWIKDYTTEWSHWSHHPNTKLESLTIFDLNFNRKISPIFNMESYFVVGYKVENKKFKAYDGSFIYSSDYGFRDNIFDMTGLGITYEETFNTLYTGLSMSKKYSKFILKGKLLYSPLVKSKNKDNHHNRSFINSNTFGNTTMISLDLGAEIPYKINTKFEITYSNVKYSETSGTTRRRYYADTYYKDDKGNIQLIPEGTLNVYGGAGISNSYSMLNISIMHKF